MRQLYLLISLQILQIRINKTELNKEKKGKHGGIILCPADGYKKEKKSSVHLLDIKEKWFLTFSNPSDRSCTIIEAGAVVVTL